MPTKRSYSPSEYRIKGEQLETILGPLESKVMKAIWSLDKDHLSVREVYNQLKEEGEIAYTTVMSTMNNLFDKGLLERRIEKGRGGLFYVYWPRFGREKLEQSTVKQVIDSLIQNFGNSVISYLTEEAASDEKKLRALKELLEEKLKTRSKEQRKS